MKSKLIHSAHGQRTFILVLGTGDEVRASIGRLAEQEGIAAAQITAIGAFARAMFRFYEWESRSYQPIPCEEQVEVVSLNGDIALDAKGKPALHLHAALGRRDGSLVGGDLQEGHVRPTLEVIVTESPAHLRRIEDPELGLALIRLQD